MRLYISGPMAGLPDLNFPAFTEAAMLLDRAGHDVLNPARHGQGHEGGVPYYMRLAFLDVLDCEGIALLDGWQKSIGANVEKDMAHILGLPVRSIWRWLS